MERQHENRRGIAAFLGAAAAVSLYLCAPARAAIQVAVNDRLMSFRDVQPQEINGRVFIPLRDVAEALNAQVTWNAATQTVNGMRAGKTFQLPIGSRSAFVGDRTVQLDEPARLQFGRTMVPLRFAAEALGADVSWHPADQRVAINLPGATPPVDNGNNNNNGSANDRETVIPARTVVQATLDERLTSRRAQVGDRFTATLDPADNSKFPEGTKFEGRITEAQTSSATQPGILDAAFDRAVLPNGDTLRISGNLAGLDRNSVRKTGDGRLESKDKGRDKFDWKWVGYGAGAGLILGGILGDDDWLKGALLGGVGGAIYSYVRGQGGNRDTASNRDRDKYHEVVLQKGAKFGIELNDRVALDLR
jgi:hypothetical protein